MLLEMAGSSSEVDVIPEFECGYRTLFTYFWLLTAHCNGLSTFACADREG